MRDTFEATEAEVHAWTCYDADRLTLPGLKVGIKDNINTLDFPTRRGSPIYKDYTPGNDARIVSKLKQAGCVIVGKTTTSEFGVHHLYDSTRNPHDNTRTPGTSSAGSAVSVATGQVPVAIGTQTGGSVIRPASYCGVWAFKPSFGLIPRTGILKTADTLDTVGIFADKPQRLREVFDILRVSGPDYPQLQNFRYSNKMKAERIDPWHPLIVEALDIHRKIYHKSLSYYFKTETERFPDLVSETFHQQVEEGCSISLDEYRRCLKRQSELMTEIESVLFDGCDFLITDSSAEPAPHDEAQRGHDTCAVWTLCGFPVINIPDRIIDGLPQGTQVVARKYHDYPLLTYAEEFSAREGLTGPNPDIRRTRWT
jgi:Asp-tRNA(Asn)/Glu-tRNA(Gln) amidotransferase A subunit family amidase